MGNMNCSGTVTSTNSNPEIELKLPSYSSRFEKPFEGFDKDYNLLLRLPLHEYQLTILNLAYSSQMRGPSSIFLDETDDDQCSVFFKNFIANHPIFYSKRDDNVNQIFVEYIRKLLSYLKKGTKNFMKKKGKEFNSAVIKKFYLCIIGILFCYSTPKGKADALFSLLANDSNCIEKNINNELMIYSIIFLASFSNYLTMKDMKNADSTLPIKIEDGDDCAQAFSPDKIDAVFQQFLTHFFGETEAKIAYSDYLNKIKGQEVAWILTPQGIRSRL